MFLVCIAVACLLFWCAALAHDSYDEIGAGLLVILGIAVIVMGWIS